MESVCKHCGVNIINVPALGDRWMHIPEEADEFHQVYAFCKSKSWAEPIDKRCDNPECQKAGNCGGECLRKVKLAFEVDNDIPPGVVLLKSMDGTVILEIVKTMMSEEIVKHVSHALNPDIPLATFELNYVGGVVEASLVYDDFSEEVNLVDGEGKIG